MKTILFLFALLPVFLPAYAGNRVRILRENGGYRLLVNGKETVIRGAGVGVGFGRGGENFIGLARELGANSVRSWGMDQTDRKYLDEAVKQGLWVDAGFWLNYPDGTAGTSYATGNAGQRRTRDQILDYVKKHRDHPAILFWNLGNEVFFNIQSEEEKVAFAKYLNTLAKDVKAVDPDHPTVYTSSGLAGLPYIEEFAPDIDVFGVNLYGGITSSLQICRKSRLNRPVLITEIGPSGPWDVPKDRNGLPIDQNDTVKALAYRNNLAETAAFRDILIGTYVFHLGETSQDSHTWWNLNFGEYKRASFREVSEVFTGRKAPVYPRIKTFTASRSSGVKPGEWLDVNLTVFYPKPDELAFEYFFSKAAGGVTQYYMNERINTSVQTSGDQTSVRAPDSPGLYRFYVLVRDKSGSAATLNVSVRVE